MAGRGLEHSEGESHGSGQEEIIFVRTRSSVTGSIQRKVPLMQGIPVEGAVDANATAAYLKQVAADLKAGRTPHRGREGSETGEAISRGDRPHRSRRRRGTWRS